jgi:hypothetical protein
MQQQLRARATVAGAKPVEAAGGIIWKTVESNSTCSLPSEWLGTELMDDDCTRANQTNSPSYSALQILSVYLRNP